MVAGFTFRNYGTFTGPADTNYFYDDSEPNWHQDLPIDTSFNITDIGVLFFQSQGLYSYFHATGNDTQNIILESSIGNLGSLTANVSQSFFNGDIVVNGNVQAFQNVYAGGSVTCAGSVNIAGVGDAATFMQQTRAIASSKKSFDIPHPTKDNHRLRYVCLEGPAAEVYYRGKLKDSTYIDLPEYWTKLVDAETIGVSLTPLGCYQELFVEKIEWGSRIVVKNNSGGPINCSYVVYGERKDVEKNIPEYQGLAPEDYPGDNDTYTINCISRK